jgi:DNA-directed RNA polymerase subunit K/omega
MVTRPVHMNRYEFVILAARRAHQLLAGCTPRLEGDHNASTMAQMEVAEGRVFRAIPGASKPLSLEPVDAAERLVGTPATAAFEAPAHAAVG